MANYDDIRRPYDEEIEKLRRLRQQTPLFLESVHAQIDLHIDDLIFERDEAVGELARLRNLGREAEIVHRVIVPQVPDLVTT